MAVEDNQRQKVIDEARACFVGGDAPKGRQLLAEALGRDPNSPDLLEALGTLEFEANNYPRAAELFNRFIALRPTAVDVMIKLALVNLKLDRLREFKAILSRAIELDPNCGPLIQSFLNGNAAQEQLPKVSGHVLASGEAQAASGSEIDEVPVVILHLGVGPYLEAVVEQARKFNRKVILIGNGVHDSLAQKASFVNLANHREEAKHFGTIYRHMSPNLDWVEVFCFQRWFILKSYMESQNLDVCFHMDSDVMLYANATEEYRTKYRDSAFDFMLVAGCCGSSSFFTRLGLERFCDFVRHAYENQDGPLFRKLLSTHVFPEQGRVEGICDMTFLQLYRNDGMGRVGEMTEVIGGSTYDHNINVSDGYAMARGYKDVQFYDGIPYVRHLGLDRMIRFNCLHFQGPAKDLLCAIHRRNKFASPRG